MSVERVSPYEELSNVRQYYIEGYAINKDYLIRNFFILIQIASVINCGYIHLEASGKTGVYIANNGLPKCS
jgi:hypothetical protein